jgi:hypothetical protein
VSINCSPIHQVEVLGYCGGTLPGTNSTSISSRFLCAHILQTCECRTRETRLLIAPCEIGLVLFGIYGAYHVLALKGLTRPPHVLIARRSSGSGGEGKSGSPRFTHAFSMGVGYDTSPHTVMCTVGRNSHEKAANHEEIR